MGQRVTSYYIFYYNKIDFENIDIDRYKHAVYSKEILLILDIYI